jgi:hypothetical protein
MSSFRLCALSYRSSPLTCSSHSIKCAAGTSASRNITSSSVLRLGGPGRGREETSQGEDGNKDGDWQPRSRRLRTRGWDRDHPPELIGWLTAGEGKQFEFAKKPRNWLGGKVVASVLPAARYAPAYMNLINSPSH